MKVLGIDPGTALLGWGIIDVSKLGRVDGASCIAYGCISTDKNMTDSQRLVAIANSLEVLLKEYSPVLVGVEKLFFSRNVSTAMTVSQARGVSLYLIEKAKIPLKEITPQEVKMALTGYGRADKQQIQLMVQRLLGLSSIPKPDDAADAIAIALTAAGMSGKGR